MFRKFPELFNKEQIRLFRPCQKVKSEGIIRGIFKIVPIVRLAFRRRTHGILLGLCSTGLNDASAGGIKGAFMQFLYKISGS